MSKSFTLGSFDGAAVHLVHAATGQKLALPGAWIAANALERRHALGQVSSTLEELAADPVDNITSCVVTDDDTVKCELSDCSGKAKATASVSFIHVERYGMRTAPPPVVPLATAKGIQRVAHSAVVAALAVLA